MKEKLQEAISLYKKGDKAQASRLLAEIVRQEPNNSVAWYGLALCLDEPDKKVYCLKKVLSLNPAHNKAKQLLERLQGSEEIPNIQKVVSTTPAPTIKEGAASNWLIIAAVGLIGVILICGVIGIIFANSMNIFQPPPTPFPTRISPTRTPQPTNTPIPTKTRAATLTPIISLYTNTPEFYIPLEADLPNNYSLLPSGSFEKNSDQYNCPGYQKTYVNLQYADAIGLAYQVQYMVYICNNNDESLNAYHFIENNASTSSSSNSTTQRVDGGYLAGTDNSSMFINARNDHSDINFAIISVFRKTNLIGIVSTVRNVLQPDEETAKTMTNEHIYFINLVLENIK